MGEAISRSDHACQTPGLLSGSDLGRAQNAGPTESATLRSTRVPEPEQLRLGSACNPGPASDNSRQSNLEPEQCRQGKHTRRERGANAVWLNYRHETASVIYWQRPSLSTARLNK